MQAVIYYISIPFIYLLSLLPYFILKRIAYVLYVLLYYVTSYRKKIIIKNLKASFPEKNNTELKALVKQFYNWFSQFILESVKLFSISEAELVNRCAYSNWHLITDSFNQGRNILILLGHFGNWEWAGPSFACTTGKKTIAAYKPLRNRYFDKLIFNSRSRLGLNLISQERLSRHLNQNNQPFIVALIADQSPGPKQHFWMPFLNQPTAVISGSDKIAQRYNCAVFYGSIQLIETGRYNVTFSLLSDNVHQASGNEITGLYMKKLEHDIRQAPALYLWTHNRWKKQPPKAL